MPDPGMIQQQEPDGMRRMQALQQGGFSPQDMLAYKQQRSQALLQGGYNQQDVDSYWGDHPPAQGSPTGDQGLLSSIAQHAWDNFTAPITSAWSSLTAQQNTNWQHAFNPTTMDQVAPQLSNGVRAAQTLWDGMGVVFSPLVGAVNVVGAPTGQRLAAAGLPAPHLTVDLKSPDSNILDPTQWQFTPSLVHGDQAGQIYGSLITGLGSLGVGGVMTPRGGAALTRASPAARQAALAAYRAGEISDPGAFAANLTRGQVSPRVQAQLAARMTMPAKPDKRSSTIDAKIFGLCPTSWASPKPLITSLPTVEIGARLKKRQIK